jgi:hypothetical protein
MRDFSFASVILSYFLVGGGMFAGTAARGVLKTSSEVVAYLLIGAGAFFGGFVAARASRGSTILEPALGAIAVVATVVGLAATTQLGKLIWGAAQDETIKLIATVGGTGVGGALAGAFLSEKLLGEATRSSIPWALYSALSTFGACLLTTLFGSILFVAGGAKATAAENATVMFIGMGAGCLLSGLAVGASARTRPLLAAFFGGGAGVAGFGALILRVTSRSDGDKDAIAGIAVLAAGGCIVTLIGTLIGWAAVGKRHAG